METTPNLNKNTLENLLRNYTVQNLLGTLDREISSVVFDSRQAQNGSLFVAIPGFQQDGSRFIKDAISRGACAVVTCIPTDHLNGIGLGSRDITVAWVEDCRNALAWLACQFYQQPSKKLSVVGITGTNGKTTVTYILESIFKTMGEKTGVIGSINYRYGGHQFPAAITTPESTEINRLLNDMVDQGVGHCFLEVSSHALALQRVQGMNFSVGVFTNLSRDHLDFHETMENYKKAKKSLFTDHPVYKCVINTDDPVGRELSQVCSSPVLTTGIDGAADIMAENMVLTDHGSEFNLKTPYGNRSVRSHLLGKHNIYNMLSAAATALVQGLSLEQVTAGLEAVERIPGRFEQVDAGQDFTVIVDYAHTDDALKNALEAARAIQPNKVIVVFGCGGDRDHGKRGAMGKVALELSDFAVITSDNPRTEDPDRIIDDICKGLPPAAQEGLHYAVCPNRREGIQRAIEQAVTGDLVLIAGKGHEDYQVLQDQTIHFDDREVARETLSQRMKRG